MNRLDPPRRLLATALAGLAGYVDAVGFLSADRYFVSFMSGNTTRLGTELIADTPRAAIPASLILGFVLGVALGHIVAEHAGRWRKPAVLGLVTLLLAIGTLVAVTGHEPAMMAALVLAMGALNTALRQGETPVALTYLTGALVRIGQGLGGIITGRREEGLGAFIGLWLALTCGAALGATLFLAFGPASLLLAVACGIATTFAGYRIARATA
ncbi:YoaK family protein [Novosphingobium sp. BL-8A]|uniref:YoaK family protein n=1 Tax=Novosphingobium sp. BL-8A TaxID=3127639 RepID=UPI0037579FC7